ncbi:MAG: hypothetical protein WCE51_07560 [Chthoniobacterales bacterium]
MGRPPRTPAALAGGIGVFFNQITGAGSAGLIWYPYAVSLNEILEAIPKLSFAERQQLVRRAIEADDDLTPHEEAVLEARMKNFRADPRDGAPKESLKSVVRERLEPR